VWLFIATFEYYALAIPPQVCTVSSSVTGSNNMADARTFDVGATLATSYFGRTEIMHLRYFLVFVELKL